MNGVPPITVVIGLHGAGRDETVRTSVRSIQRQTVPVGVVLSELGDRPLYGGLATELGVAHVLSPLPSQTFGGRFCPCVTRNAGIAFARPGWVYESDGDIVFPSATFFERLAGEVCSNEQNVAIYPAMKHLLAESVPEFLRQADVAFSAGALPPSSFVEFRGGRFVANAEREVFVRSGRHPWVTTESRRRAAESLPYHGRGYERITAAEPTFHYGALLAHSELLLRLGGYCEEFVGYGFGDIDMVWKITRRASVITLYASRPDLLVLHLDHARSYFDRIVFERNMLLHRFRQLRGIESAVSSDRQHLQSAMQRMAR